MEEKYRSLQEQHRELKRQLEVIDKALSYERSQIAYSLTGLKLGDVVVSKKTGCFLKVVGFYLTGSKISLSGELLSRDGRPSGAYRLLFEWEVPNGDA